MIILGRWRRRGARWRAVKNFTVFGLIGAKFVSAVAGSGRYTSLTEYSQVLDSGLPTTIYVERSDENVRWSFSSAMEGSAGGFGPCSGRQCRIYEVYHTLLSSLTNEASMAMVARFQ